MTLRTKIEEAITDLKKVYDKFISCEHKVRINSLEETK